MLISYGHYTYAVYITETAYMHYICYTSNTTSFRQASVLCLHLPLFT